MFPSPPIPPPPPPPRPNAAPSPRSRSPPPRLQITTPARGRRGRGGGGRDAAYLVVALMSMAHFSSSASQRRAAALPDRLARCSTVSPFLFAARMSTPVGDII